MGAVDLCRQTRFDAMAWAIPDYPRNRVDGAGFTLIRPSADNASLAQAYAVINNWRSSHSYPLNTFQMTLRKKCEKLSSSYIVAQRIKRLVSIRAKLARFDTMQLSQMQDIGGCRAILQTVNQVNKLVELYRKSRFDHILHNSKDYVDTPKPEGYRSIHLIFQYKGHGPTTVYDDHRIEVQIRTVLQHVWATAVETVDMFTRQALKSSLGNPDWLRFFALMGSIIAEREKTPPVPNTPNKHNALVSEIRALSDSLMVQNTLRTYGTTLTFLTKRKPRREKYYLLDLRPETGDIYYYSYPASESQAANEDYLVLERGAQDSAENKQIVLVSVDSISALERAYPNYFGDTARFSVLLTGVLDG